MGQVENEQVEHEPAQNERAENQQTGKGQAGRDDTVWCATLAEWHRRVTAACAPPGRLAGLYATEEGGTPELVAIVGRDQGFLVLRAPVGHDLCYDALTPQVPAAFWYERALHDLSGLEPAGHPRLEPLLLPHLDDLGPVRPGSDLPARGHDARLGVEHVGPVDVTGRGVFTLPFGPVRSGVLESLELLLETGGEDILRINLRPHYKHRQIAKRFEQRTIEDAVLVAERVEGVHSVAHALAFVHAVETGTGVQVPAAARLQRVVVAELERIANHLDVVTQLCDCAGLAVGTARFGLHKEEVMRLMSDATGSRFGRGQVVAGGVRAALRVDPALIGRRVRALQARIADDLGALNSSASFLDRLRTTGRLATDLARRHGALGPVGRGSAVEADTRVWRPYDGYRDLTPFVPATSTLTDALGRLRVRETELAHSSDLISEAADQLTQVEPTLRTPVPPADGRYLGVAESAAGEVLYSLSLQGARVVRCFARSASFHNLVLMHNVFHGDVFTDLGFIEASFGLCYAGVAM
ncbi:NADH-quinone oxidoreductase subunit C [Flexivirga caeni]|uniref:NADH-quinone oxidoreductase subunit D n=1 Tax=Flexivirga caeni TaxID=2294115 RepID=A0A3M9MI57_9MICO|nr:NADH-quinone oxidoreductase subunit C [Flexivirga caeni]RNI24837.1 NADH-quinone oxidoreductase subunit D [Flexivirga caeni]